MTIGCALFHFLWLVVYCHDTRIHIVHIVHIVHIAYYQHFTRIDKVNIR